MTDGRSAARDRAPTRIVEVRLGEAAPSPEAILLAPRPFDHWGQRLAWWEIDGVRAVSEIGATNSDCRAFLCRPEAGAAPRFRYAFELTEDAAPDWAWRVQSNRYTTADPNLCALAREATIGAPDQSEALRRIVANASEAFGYDHADEAFNDGHDAVPTICGTVKGNCVDINTYILAAALSLGLKGQYVAGYWFHPHKTETADMHCWLVFEPEGADGPVFWDLAHALKWRETLGARIGEGLNPAGGRRVAMSCGRGLVFETPHGAVEISHFAEPVWILPDGAQMRPELRALVEDPAATVAARGVDALRGSAA